MPIRMNPPDRQVKFNLNFSNGLPANFRIDQPDAASAVITYPEPVLGASSIQLTMTRVTQGAAPGFGFVIKGNGYLDLPYYIPIDALVAPTFSIDDTPENVIHLS